MSTWPPSQPALPPPGWYTDPANPSAERWWSGNEWTHDTRQPEPVFSMTTAPVSDAFTPMPQAGAAEYVPMSGAARSVDHSFSRQSPQFQGSPSTVPIWIIVLYPALISAIQYIVLLSLSIAAVTPPAYLTGGASYFLILILAAWDSSVLRQRGLPAPSFLWALLTGLGYLIARVIKVKRAGERHWAPFIAYFVSVPVIYILFTIGVYPLVVQQQTDVALARIEKQLEQEAARQSPGAWTANCPPAPRLSETGAVFYCTLTNPATQPVTVTLKVIYPYTVEIQQ